MVADAVAEKAAFVAPAVTVAVAGTVTLVLLLLNPTTNPPVRAAPLSVTVHAETPAALTVVGVHENPVKVGWTGCGIVRIPPVPEAGIEVLPVISVAITPVNWMGAEVSNEPGATVKVALAMTPLLRMSVLDPDATHVVEVLLLEQATLLLAPVAPEPALTVTFEISVDE
jgi:hypothetical protein